MKKIFLMAVAVVLAGSAGAQYIKDGSFSSTGFVATVAQPNASSVLDKGWARSGALNWTYDAVNGYTTNCMVGVGYNGIGQIISGAGISGEMVFSYKLNYKIVNNTNSGISYLLRIVGHYDSNTNFDINLTSYNNVTNSARFADDSSKVWDSGQKTLTNNANTFGWASFSTNIYFTSNFTYYSAVLFVSKIQGGQEDYFAVDDVSLSNAVYYTLTVNANPGGTATGGGLYPAGANPQITATASNWYTWSGWTGAVTSANSTTNVLMTGNKTVWANFVPDPIKATTFTLE